MIYMRLNKLIATGVIYFPIAFILALYDKVLLSCNMSMGI